MARKKRRRSNKGLYITLALIIIGLLAFAAIGKKQGWIGKKALTKISAEAAKKRTIIETVSASGKLYPETEVKVTPDVSGEIITLAVIEGDSIKQGALIARIQPDLQETIVEQAQAGVNSAISNTKNIEAGIAQIDVQISQAKTDYDRTKKLFDQDVVSAVELQNAELALNNLKAQKKAQEKSLDAANFNVQSAQAGLKESKKSLARTNIYAPISGIVSSMNVKLGERVVGTSQFEGTEIMRISNFNNFEVQVEVSENDIIKVSEGDTAEVEIDAYYNRTFLGVVKQISNATGTGAAAMLSSDQVTNYTVKIILLQSSYADLIASATNSFVFRPGMSATVEIQTQKLGGIITVPIQSVTVRDKADSLKTNKDKEELIEVLFVLNEGKVYQKEVKTGTQDDTYIEVLEGVKDGEEVVTAPYRAITKKLKHEDEVEKVDKKDLFKNKEE